VNGLGQAGFPEGVTLAILPAGTGAMQDRGYELSRRPLSTGSSE
jgi:hypothetical protein